MYDYDRIISQYGSLKNLTWKDFQEIFATAPKICYPVPDPETVMSSDVFRPSEEPLILRGAITTGANQSMDNYRKEQSTPMTRPHTNGGYRFGHLSQNAFFARHNPHPGRVRHIKGLLDVPICSVNDKGFLSNPRYAPTFPPNAYNASKLSRYNKHYNIPAASVNVNSQLHPINTITGLQYFLGKPMNMRVFREKVAFRNSGGTNEAWHDELRALTEALGVSGPSAPPARKPDTSASQRPRGTQYSETTGRILPPPSRAMSRGGPSRGQTPLTANMVTAMNGGGDPESEEMVLGLLAQILQTDDVGAVQQWLVGAGDREKVMVLDLIRQAMEAKNATSNEYNPIEVPADYSAPVPEPRYDDTDVIGDSDVNEKIDRLTLEPSTPPRPMSKQNGRPRSQQLGRPKSQSSVVLPAEPVTMRYMTPQKPQNNGTAKFSYPIPEEVRPVTAGAAFRASRSAGTPMLSRPPPTHSAAFRPQTSTRPPTSGSSLSASVPGASSESPLRYEVTAALEHSLRDQKMALRDVLAMDAGTQTWTPPGSAPKHVVAC